MAKKKKQHIYYFYKDYAKVSEQTIEWACDNGMERQLEFFLKLKRNYKSGFIHNPLQQFKTLKTGVSKATFKRRLTQLENLGWIQRGRNYIRLISVEKLPVHDVSKRVKYIKIQLDKLNYNSLRGLLIKKSERTQKFKLKHSENSGQEVYSSVNGNLVGTNTRTNRDVNLSCSGIADIINRSKATAYRLKSRLKKQGLIRSAKRFIFDPNAKYNKVYDSKGNLFRRTSDIIQTTYPNVKINFVPKTTEEKVISMYTNDCF